MKKKYKNGDTGKSLSGDSKSIGAKKMQRRDVIMGLTTIPVLGIFGFCLTKKVQYDRKKQRYKKFLLGSETTEQVSKSRSRAKVEIIRIGIIGFGGRGEYLARALGFAHPEWIEQKRRQAEQNPLNTNLKDFMNQDDLQIRITGICDVWDRNAERGIIVSKDKMGPGGRSTRDEKTANWYRDYRELLEDKTIEAVVIATPDHWHARMTMDAIQAGKHVYQEKCLTKTVEEACQVYRVVTKSARVFQLGHQNHQTTSHIKARDIIKRGLLGHINLVEGSTNRYREGLKKIDPRATTQTVDWEQFQGPSSNRYAFNSDRYFNWRNYWDYGTGLFGDLLSHEYAAINQILGCGIPGSAVCSGGIYLWKKRETPDVFSVVFEYPQQKMSMIYSLTMGNSHDRGRYFMGTDGVMTVGQDVVIQIEAGSEQFKEQIDNRSLDPSKPIRFTPGKGIDTVTSATEKYFSEKGIYFTYVDGKLVDATYLHIKDWLDCIRYGGIPRCHIDLGFEEAISCQMALKAFLEGRKVIWDPVKERIV